MKSSYTYYTQNTYGDVVNLTDEIGAVTKSYTYDAFGIVASIMIRKSLPFICVQDITTLTMDCLSQEILLLAGIMIH